jgi:hypothetical protein
MVNIGKIVIIAGVALVVMGAVIYLAGRMNLPIGRLPGDIRIQRENFTFYFPLATSIILSILLTIGLNLLLRWLNRK